MKLQIILILSICASVMGHLRRTEKVHHSLIEDLNARISDQSRQVNAYQRKAVPVDVHQRRLFMDYTSLSTILNSLHRDLSRQIGLVTNLLTILGEKAQTLKDTATGLTNAFSNQEIVTLMQTIGVLDMTKVHTLICSAYELDSCGSLHAEFIEGNIHSPLFLLYTSPGESFTCDNTVITKYEEGMACLHEKAIDATTDCSDPAVRTAALVTHASTYDVGCVSQVYS